MVRPRAYNGGVAQFEYSPLDNIWFVNVFAHAHFVTEQQVKATFAACRQYWQTHIKKRTYTLVDYTDTVVDASVAQVFGAERKKIVEDHTLATFRFTNDLTARTAIRAISIKIHQPSNLYASRDEALSVLRSLQLGQIAAGNEGA
jgi:hypothetical protein